MRRGKTRPVVVVAEVGMGDSIVCPITTQESGKCEDIPISAVDDVVDGELDFDSWARTNRLYTLNKSVLRCCFIGRLTDAKTDEILAAVRALF